MPSIPTIAEMGKVIKFELMDKDADGTGGRLEHGTEWFTTRGSFKEVSGYRKFENGYDETVTVADIYVHWRQELDNNLSKDVQIIYDNRFFTIEHYKRVNEDRRLMQITVKEAR